MSPLLLQELHARAASIRQRWETLLRIEPVCSPLANPDALVHLIPNSLQEILSVVAKPLCGAPCPPIAKPRLPTCDCGNNPYLAYYIAGEQAIVEALVLAQAGFLPHDRHENDLSDLILAIRKLAGLEIDSFCGVCTHRGKAEKCRHATVTSLVKL